MKFTKMHGAGNDYLYLDGLSRRLPKKNYRKLAREMSDRRFGVGADGIILIQPSRRADCRMEMYNADGSRGKMCGNGIRCVAKFVYDHRLRRKKKIRIETDSGIKEVEVFPRAGEVRQVRVDMDKPIFERKKIPMRGPGKDGLQESIRAAGRTFRAMCLSMGNPHCVIFVPDERKIDLPKYGEAIQKLPRFPQSVNVEFIRVSGRGKIYQRTWERGSGETYACGTGACAAGVATILKGKAKDRVEVELLGGKILVEWKPGETVWMTGPAEEVCTGDWPD